MGRPRIIISKAWRKQVFGAVHSLAHRSGKSTLEMLSCCYMLPGIQKDMITRRKSCNLCVCDKVASPLRWSQFLSPQIQACPCRPSWPFSTRSRLLPHLDSDRQDNALARSFSSPGHKGTDGCTSIHQSLGGMLWSFQSDILGERGTVYI